MCVCVCVCVCMRARVRACVLARMRVFCVYIRFRIHASTPTTTSHSPSQASAAKKACKPCSPLITPSHASVSSCPCSSSTAIGTTGGSQRPFCALPSLFVTICHYLSAILSEKIARVGFRSNHCLTRVQLPVLQEHVLRVHAVLVQRFVRLDNATHVHPTARSTTRQPDNSPHPPDSGTTCTPKCCSAWCSLPCPSSSTVSQSATSTQHRCSLARICRLQL